MGNSFRVKTILCGRVLFSIIWSVFSQFPYSFAADFTGQVVSVLDGDTIDVLHDQHPERIRLNGIDCPEKGQAFGKQAKRAVSELALERN